MKKSITHLPKRKQEDLNNLVMAINKKLPQAQFIILFGSYARNEFVDYDERDEFGIRTSFMSDYDILVATDGISDRDAGRILDSIHDKYYQHPENRLQYSLSMMISGNSTATFRKADIFTLKSNVRV